MGTVVVGAVVAAVGVVFGWYLWRNRTPNRLSLALRRTGLGIMAMFVLFASLFVVGETAADPGGWLAAALILAWAVPLTGLSVLAWYRPRAAIPVLVAGTAVVLALAGWYAADPDGWHAFENAHGPVRALAAFALTGPAAVLGRRYPGIAALILLGLGAVPVTVAAISLGAGWGFAAGSLGALAMPPTITAVLYLLAAVVGGRTQPLVPRRSARGPCGRSPDESQPAQ